MSDGAALLLTTALGAAATTAAFVLFDPIVGWITLVASIAAFVFVLDNRKGSGGSGGSSSSGRSSSVLDDIGDAFGSSD